jgi:hypothetical protein
VEIAKFEKIGQRFFHMANYEWRYSPACAPEYRVPGSVSFPQQSICFTPPLPHGDKKSYLYRPEATAGVQAKCHPNFYFCVLLFRSEVLIQMLEALERKRAELMREVHAVTAAIKAYADTLSRGHANTVKKAGTTKKVSKKHTMSAATKKKLSLAAKARWAKVNAKKAS